MHNLMSYGELDWTKVWRHKDYTHKLYKVALRHLESCHAN